MFKIGQVERITRYPVKSFSGENVQSVRVMNYGLYGDRSHAIIDQTKGGSFLTITQFPEMATYSARFVSEDSLDEYPELELNLQQDQLFYWGEPDTLALLEAKTNKQLQFVKYAVDHVPLGAIEEEHLLFISQSSLEQLAKELHIEGINAGRFRPNFIYSLEQLDINEDELYGKIVQIGAEVRVKFIRECERCSIINVDPKSGERDSKYLKHIVRNRGHFFGQYASVIQTGEVHEGDSIYLLA